MAKTAQRKTLEKILKYALERGASDIHIVAEQEPYIRIDTKLERVTDEFDAISDEDVRKMADTFLTDREQSALKKEGDVDAGAIIDGTSLRVNVHEQSTGMGLAIRVVPRDIPSPEALNFHDTMMQIPRYENGLIIVTGPAGSGKSTTLAALVEMMNQSEENKHVITLEDPIEYRFENKNSLIEQRELHRHFRSFPSGLRHVLRQDPNVIVVGEMRDPDTISLALTAAETGHLVISTLHTPNAPEAIERIVNVYSGPEQKQILTQLAATLRMVVAQKLFPKKEGGLIAAWEILVSTTAVQNAIRQNRLSTVQSAIQTGKKQGMITMERSMQQIANEIDEETLERSGIKG